MFADCGDDPCDQCISGAAGFGVVLAVEPDGVDVRDDQAGAGALVAIDVVLEVLESCGSGSRARQRISLGHRKRERERFTIAGSPLTVAGRPFSVHCRGLPIAGRLPAMLEGLRAMLCGPPALLGGTHDDLSARDRTRTIARKREVVLGHRDVTCRRGLIAQPTGEIAGVSAPVTLACALQPSAPALLALTGGASATVAADLVREGVDTKRQVTVAGGLIAIRRDLI